MSSKAGASPQGSIVTPEKPSQVSDGSEGTNEKELPFIARFLNHILTPGSSLTPTVWIIFNVIMVLFFLCWFSFVLSMPTNIHVWMFGVLAVGLTVSTNWFMKLVFSGGLDFHSQQALNQQQSATGSETIGDTADSSEKPSLQEKKNN